MMIEGPVLTRRRSNPYFMRMVVLSGTTHFSRLGLLTATADLHYAGDRRDARAIEYEHHVLAGWANIRVRGRDHGQGFLPFFKPNAIDALTEIKMVSHRA
jgi:hypothetical protein